MERVQHVFLVGAKSLGTYGGYETFVSKLTQYHQNNTRIKYHVACKANGGGCMDPYKTEGAVVLNETEFIYHNAHCFRIRVPEKLGPAQAVFYDCLSLKRSIEIIKEQKLSSPVVYIMACRIGPFMKRYYREIRKLGGRVYLNPDGHEWMRAKWSLPVRKYWKSSEALMVRYSDLVICDSLQIEKYIHDCYDRKGRGGRNPDTTFLAYGAETGKSPLADDDRLFTGWLKENDLKRGEYYLAVGRFVPENNYETMLREFMMSDTKRDLAVITTENRRYYDELERKLGFAGDRRVKFVGTVYNQKLLKKIRENACGYLHGHEVGGTNPSLLEALASTELNLLLDVGFNREAGLDGAVYWTKEPGNLCGLIEQTDRLGDREIRALGRKARARIQTEYSWEKIVGKYERLFLSGKTDSAMTT